MIQDLEQGLTTQSLTADVCIIGAGPAGISLALELARARPDWHIVLTEAGGPQNASQTERDIYKVSLGDKSYGVLDVSRRRKLGGTTAHWGGWSKPLDDTDFEDNNAWDVPAWPITKQEVSSHIPRALKWTEIDSGDFHVNSIRKTHNGKLLPLRKDGAINEQLFRFSPPTRFGDKYYDELKAQDNLTCLLHANCYELVRDGDKVTSAKVRPLNGNTLEVNSQTFTLAMGGMETTRLLMNLRGDKSADGEGIYSDHLGRYFADHFGVRPGEILAPEGLKYSRFGDQSGPIMPVLTFAARDIRNNGEHNSCMMLQASAAPESLLAGYGGTKAAGFYASQYWHYSTQMIIEPRPNPTSTLTLTDERCALGLRRMKLDWQPHEDDFASAYRLFNALGDELGQTGLGRLNLSRPNSNSIRENVSGACHHLGTTRMAADSRDGVVDSNLKVFGQQNLYVASSSVFPRYGYSNPTLTIVALSVRLAQHLANKSEVAA